MNVFVVMVKDLNGVMVPIWIDWTKELAQERAANLGNVQIVETPMDNIANLVQSYYQFRQYKDPDFQEAFNWLVSEIGELAGAINQTQTKGWVRNHDHSQDNAADELGDVLMMLVKTAEKAGVDILEVMTEKWAKKGWRQS